MVATTRHASPSMRSRAAASPRARPSEGVITLNDMRATMATGGRLAKTESCWAARTSLMRVEMAMPAQIDQPATSGVKSSWTRRWSRSKTAEATAGWAKSCGGGEEDPEDHIGDGEGGEERGQGLADEELFSMDGGGEDRFEGALLALADDRVGGEDRGDDGRDDQHVEQGEPDAVIQLGARDRDVDREELDHGERHEDEWQERHGEDDEAVAAVVAELLLQDRADPGPAEAHRRFASTSSSMSSR